MLDLLHLGNVIGNVVLVFGLEVVLDLFCYAILLFSIWFFIIEGNLTCVIFTFSKNTSILPTTTLSSKGNLTRARFHSIINSSVFLITTL